jgi:CheY-like chemotaxis protein
VKRILVVEDNPDNMYVMDRILTHYGFSVHESTSGEEALRLLETNVYDLVLMDMQMPGLDGYAAVRKLRAFPSMQHVPVIAVTANSMPGDRARSLEAGCTDYMSKPIDTRELVRLIEYYLGGTRGDDDSDR